VRHIGTNSGGTSVGGHSALGAQAAHSIRRERKKVLTNHCSGRSLKKTSCGVTKIIIYFISLAIFRIVATHF